MKRSVGYRLKPARPVVCCKRRLGIKINIMTTMVVGRRGCPNNGFLVFRRFPAKKNDYRGEYKFLMVHMTPDECPTNKLILRNQDIWNVWHIFLIQNGRVRTKGTSWNRFQLSENHNAFRNHSSFTSSARCN